MSNADLKFHPLANDFPLLEGQEFDDLVADIKAHGLHEPIVIFQGQILDGRNRYRACEAAGVTYVADNILDPGFDAVAYVVSKNIHRRHLKPEKRNELIAELLKLNPHKSDRQFAKEIGVDHKTIGAVRRKAEDVGSIPHVEKRTDTKGRKQAAHKSTNRRSPERRQTITDLNSLAWSSASHNKRTEFVRNVGLVHIWEEADDDQQTALAALLEKILDQHLKDEKDEDVFTAIVTNLARLTKKNNTERFANTSLSFKDLRALGHFFLDLANVCEKKRKVEIDAKREAEVAAILGEAAP